MQNSYLKTSLFALIALTGLIACTGKTYSAQEITAKCEAERREASGVQGAVSVGANSRSGPSVGLSLSVSDKYLRGLDPQAVYDQCVQKLNDHNAKVAMSAMQ